jgi:hypothetical protein
LFSPDGMIAFEGKFITNQTKTRCSSQKSGRKRVFRKHSLCAAVG